MDPKINPYSPGAGTIPPQLAGRDEIISKADIALERCKNNLSFRGLLLVGLRGVGKTVLLTKITQEAESKSFIVVSLEAPEGRSLPALLIPALRSALLRLDRVKARGDLAKKALHTLGGFLSAMRMKYDDVEFYVDLEKELGSADSGDLEQDLTDLFLAVGAAAKEKKTAIVLAIDEIQYLPEEQFAALIMALHKCTQRQIPVILIGAGLPQLVAQAGEAKSYAERLFEYPEIGPLDVAAARNAIVTPAKFLSVDYDEQAVQHILDKTKGYPYFLQEWGKHCWQAADASPITLSDAQFATQTAIAELDSSFFRVRYDRLTPTEKKYLRAMAELGPGLHRSGDIAQFLKKEVNSVAPARASLIKKGMIYSPSHGDNAFTVPLFDEFMKRVIPQIDSI
jgi:hypothetical protein